MSGSRPKHVPGAGIALLAWLAAVGAILAGTAGCGHPDSPARAAASAGDSTACRPYGWSTCIDTVRAGDTFGSILLRNSVHVEEAGRIVDYVRSRDLFSLRRLRPGEPIRIRSYPDGRFAALQYERNPEEVYVVECVVDGFHGYVSSIDYDLALCKIAGAVESTVEEALAEGGPMLTAELASILAYEIDFFTEPRAGDDVCMLVEEKWLGEEFLGYGRIRYLCYQGQVAAVEAAWFQDDGQSEGGYYTESYESLTRAFLRSPLNYGRISSHFSRSRFHPILRTWRPHLGVDYAAPAGTPVVAVGDGSVCFAGTNGGFGRQVKIRHGSKYETWYGHLSRIARGVVYGERIGRGEVIGYVGSSGLATGPHLDFRLKENGRFIDPLKMGNPRSESICLTAQPRFSAGFERLAAVADSLCSGERMVWRRRGAPA